jgi:hypothetical protein
VDTLRILVHGSPLMVELNPRAHIPGAHHPGHARHARRSSIGPLASAELY